ncbi:hypothetical protein CNMCM5793_005732 [Aspergillus hiratsukae]|uniref:Uncharacterized protein n=1 Tax=Aspergillus hiratsukae TaxID=1194566 RepID=A0A8H6PGP7_9EURO|nr:hypothetical protein CNMCM5793_005732 [Aspergillus hiratsukae]
MTPVERRIEDAKNADRQAVRRAMLKLEQRAEWKHADPEEQSCLEEATKQQIMDTRIRDGCAAVCVADSLGYTEQSISATWDNGNAASPTVMFELGEALLATIPRLLMVRSQRARGHFCPAHGGPLFSLLCFHFFFVFFVFELQRQAHRLDGQGRGAIPLISPKAWEWCEAELRDKAQRWQETEGIAWWNSVLHTPFLSSSLFKDLAKLSADSLRYICAVTWKSDDKWDMDWDRNWCMGYGRIGGEFARTFGGKCIATGVWTYECARPKDRSPADCERLREAATRAMKNSFFKETLALWYYNAHIVLEILSAFPALDYLALPNFLHLPFLTVGLTS